MGDTGKKNMSWANKVSKVSWGDMDDENEKAPQPQKTEEKSEKNMMTPFMSFCTPHGFRIGNIGGIFVFIITSEDSIVGCLINSTGRIVKNDENDGIFTISFKEKKENGEMKTLCKEEGSKVLKGLSEKLSEKVGGRKVILGSWNSKVTNNEFSSLIDRYEIPYGEIPGMFQNFMLIPALAKIEYPEIDISCVSPGEILGKHNSKASNFANYAIVLSSVLSGIYMKYIGHPNDYKIFLCNNVYVYPIDFAKQRKIQATGSLIEKMIGSKWIE
jgi:hypothetical protein